MDEEEIKKKRREAIIHAIENVDIEKGLDLDALFGTAKLKKNKFLI